MVSLRGGMIFLKNLTFTPSFFWFFFVPNHINHPSQMVMFDDFLGIPKAWHHGRMGILDRQDSAPIIKDVYSWRKHPSQGSNVYSYPLVNLNKKTMERSTIFNGKTHYKWQFSIAMLNYQRVDHVF